MFTHTHTHTQTHMHTHTCTCTHADVCICMCHMCMCVGCVSPPLAKNAPVKHPAYKLFATSVLARSCDAQVYVCVCMCVCTHAYTHNVKLWDLSPCIHSSCILKNVIIYAFCSCAYAFTHTQQCVHIQRSHVSRMFEKVKKRTRRLQKKNHWEHLPSL
jgi:hypothetical protein